MQHDTPAVPEVLEKLLRLRRPYGSVEEKAASHHVFDIAWNCGANPVYDTIGNLVCQVGEDNGIVFTAHFDTVHSTPGTQDLFSLDLPNGIFIGATHNGVDTVLGADDAAGIFLLTEMIQAGIQGKYMFFVGEECGGIGSSAFVQDNPQFSANAVISFDRRGTGSVITHQGGFRTCSDGFGAALASALNQNGVGKLQYRIDDAGLYTDSREFAEIVPECTNISVGYLHEHTAKETLNLTHLLNLRDAVLKVQWDVLPIVRVPEPDIIYDTSWIGRQSAWYDVPKDEHKELQQRLTQYLNGNWDTVDAKLRQLLLDLEEHFNDTI